MQPVYEIFADSQIGCKLGRLEFDCLGFELGFDSLVSDDLECERFVSVPLYLFGSVLLWLNKYRGVSCE
jgi:hypothetical protein